MTIAPDHDQWNRYDRQIVLPEIGPSGQTRLSSSRVLIIGCGALGGHIAMLLVRAGVGFIRLVDRDIVELGNLHRQILFDEIDASRESTKAQAAARKLKNINSSVRLEPMVADVTAASLPVMLVDVDLVIDGSDNFETRFLINDSCVKNRIPWIFGGVVGTSGMTMTILPESGPCLRCLFDELPDAGVIPTVDRDGVLGTAPAAIAALQATHAMRILTGSPPSPGHLYTLDVWESSWTDITVHRADSCPACVENNFFFMSQSPNIISTIGDRAIQFTAVKWSDKSFDRITAQIGFRDLTLSDSHAMPIDLDGVRVVFFRDGRLMVMGFKDPLIAARAISDRLADLLRETDIEFNLGI